MKYAPDRKLLPLIWLTLLAAVLTPATHARAASPQDVRDAIRRGVAFLYDRQDADGKQWENVDSPNNPTDVKTRYTVNGGQWGGRTALATYALLASGEDPRDPRLAKAIAWLRKADTIGNYAIGIRAQVWTFLPPSDENRQAVRRDANLLGKGVAQGGKFRGTWGYIVNQNIFRFDMSVSQYGVLGMWACSREVEVPRPFWQAVETAWLKVQQPNGGWSYEGDDIPARPVSPSITAAGVASLFITQEFLHSDEGLNCRGNISNPAIEAGINYLAGEFPKLVADAPIPARHYTLYGIERIGVASGYKYLNDVDWFQTGADYLVRTQAPEGAWNGDDGPEVVTSFSLLFLSRGAAPVAINKLQYTINPRDKQQEGNWNQRPRDVANATKYVAKQTERDLNWQIINLDVAKDNDLNDAPILYLSGDQTLDFTDEQKAKLRTFVEEGGLILGNADCGRTLFTRSFQKLGQELFKEGGYEFRKLPDNSPILVNEQFNASKWRRKVDVLGLSNGARELMLLVPRDDLGRTYQKQDLAQESEFQFLTNVFLYSVDKQSFKNKGESFVVRPDPGKSPSRTIDVARVKFNGIWNPEPYAWTRLAAVMHNDYDANLNVTAVPLADLGSNKARVAALTGTSTFLIDAAGEKAIKDYVDGGGTLVVDAAGGDGEFASSVEKELVKIFGADAEKELGKPLEAGDPVFSLDGREPLKVAYTNYSREKLLGSLDAPRLRGLKINGRLAVIYSPEDLSVGLMGHPYDGITGYTPATATDLMARIVLNSAK